jgi:hypothetical protein
MMLSDELLGHLLKGLSDDLQGLGSERRAVDELACPHGSFLTTGIGKIEPARYLHPRLG